MGFWTGMFLGWLGGGLSLAGVITLMSAVDKGPIGSAGLDHVCPECGRTESYR